MTRARIAIGERELSNGLTLLAVQNPGVPVCAALVALDVSLRDDPEGQEGLASLVGECLEEGTVRRDGVALAEAVESLGAQVDSHPAGATVQCPAEALPKALALLREVVFEPSFPAREVKRVLQETLTEIQADQDEPGTVASQEFARAVYGRHPYGRPARGTVESVRSLKVGDVRRFHRKNYVPTRGHVVVAGPDEVEKALDRLARVFRGVDGRRPERAPLPEPALASRASDRHIPMPREQVHVLLGHLGIRRQHPDYYALSVMDHILGTGPGFTSRISRKLRDEMGLCYSVDAAISRSAREEPGCFSAYIGTSPEHRQKAIDGFLAEMRAIQARVPSVQELEDVQRYLTGSFVWQFERVAALARYAYQAKRFGLGFDYMRRYPKLIEAITRDDVKRVAREHLHPDRVTIVSAGAG